MTIRPALHVEFDLLSQSGAFVIGSSLLGGSDLLGTGSAVHNWTTIPEKHVESVSIRRGGKENQPIQPGELTFRLDNSTGAYDPDNASSSYRDDDGYTLLTKGLGVRVRAVWQGTSYVLYSGKIENVDCDIGELPPLVTFTCTDPLGWLGSQQVTDLELPAFEGDTTATRVGRILDIAGWEPSARSLAGIRTMMATTLGGTALSLCEEAARCEFGKFFATRSGVVVLYPYATWTTTTNRFTFTENGANIPYERLKTSAGGRQLCNQATVQQTSELSQTAQNGASIGKFGRYERTVSAPILGSSAAMAVAQLMADRNALPSTRVEVVEFSEATLQVNAAQWANVLQCEISDRATVTATTFDGRSITWINAIVDTISHDITATSWNIAYEMSGGTIA